MIRKLASLAGAGAILLGMATPALAWHWWSDDDVSIRNRSFLMNDVTTKADSGDNKIFAFDDVEGGVILTGAAVAAASLKNDVNTSIIGCGCLDGDLTIRNGSFLMNDLYTKADSGDNRIVAFDDVEGGRIDTGDAVAGASVMNSVNFTLVGGLVD